MGGREAAESCGRPREVIWREREKSRCERSHPVREERLRARVRVWVRIRVRVRVRVRSHPVCEERLLRLPDEPGSQRVRSEGERLADELDVKGELGQRLEAELQLRLRRARRPLRHDEALRLERADGHHDRERHAKLAPAQRDGAADGGRRRLPLDAPLGEFRAAVAHEAELRRMVR